MKGFLYCRRCCWWQQRPSLHIWCPWLSSRCWARSETNASVCTLTGKNLLCPQLISVTLPKRRSGCRSPPLPRDLWLCGSPLGRQQWDWAGETRADWDPPFSGNLPWSPTLRTLWKGSHSSWERETFAWTRTWCHTVSGSWSSLPRMVWDRACCWDTCHFLPAARRRQTTSARHRLRSEARGGCWSVARPARRCRSGCGGGCWRTGPGRGAAWCSGCSGQSGGRGGSRLGRGWGGHALRLCRPWNGGRGMYVRSWTWNKGKTVCVCVCIVKVGWLILTNHNCPWNLLQMDCGQFSAVWSKERRKNSAHEPRVTCQLVLESSSIFEWFALNSDFKSQ